MAIMKSRNALGEGFYQHFNNRLSVQFTRSFLYIMFTKCVTILLSSVSLTHLYREVLICELFHSLSNKKKLLTEHLTIIQKFYPTFQLATYFFRELNAKFLKFKTYSQQVLIRTLSTEPTGKKLAEFYRRPKLYERLFIRSLHKFRSKGAIF